MPIRILLSGAGGGGTIEIIRTLREMGLYRIVAIDASPHAFGLKLADVGYVVPLATVPEFERTIEMIIGREEPDYIIPLVDEEILTFHAIAKQFNTRVVAPVPQFCQLCLDKWQTNQALRDAGIPVPKTWLATDTNKVRYPAIIKPRSGRGSRGLAYLRQVSDLEEYLMKAHGSPQEYIAQEQIEGREFTVSVVVGLGGPLLAVVPKEVIIKRGITLVGVTRDVPEIESMCRQIQDRLRADGPFNVQLIMKDDGVPYVTEINPRYSTTVALTIAAGVHEVDLVIRNAEGEQTSSPIDFTHNLMMIRYYVQEYIPESHWVFERTQLNFKKMLKPGAT